MQGDGDGWVVCDQGHRHWGRHGAAGLLLFRRDTDGATDPAGARFVLLQHRALWSHHGGTWGLPGGARDSHETSEETALREAAEEVGLDPGRVAVRSVRRDDHGGWSYDTVVADCVLPVEARPTGGESVEVRWVPEETVDELPLHPGFAVTWPALAAL